MEDVYLLARAYNIRDNAGISIFVDPWTLQKRGHILLEAECSYTAHVPTTTVPFSRYSPTNSNQADTHAVYKGLDVNRGKIRLLHLQLDDEGVDEEEEEEDNGDAADAAARKYNRPLRGSLEVVDLNENPVPFWAISYCWGPKPEGPNPPTFTTEQGTIPITDSLAACFKCLRQKKVPFPLWADAICINQDNALEKAWQVSRMGALYNKAQKVIVWLGTGDHTREVSDALVWMTKWHHGFCSTGEFCHTEKRPSDPIHDRLPDRDDPGWTDVNWLLGHSWFTRSWIVQEAAVCPNMTIVCGGPEMSWDCFMGYLLKCGRSYRLEESREAGLGRERDDNGDSFLTYSRPARALHRLRKKYLDGSRFELLELLDMFSYTRSSRPRDKLFSLQNLAANGLGEVSLSTHNSDDALFRPDYDSRQEVVVYRYAKGFVKMGNGLDLLYRAGRNKGSVFCSWVPDFLDEHRCETTLSTWDVIGKEDNFCAGKRSSPSVVLASSGSTQGILVVRGNVVDEVDGCSDAGLSLGGYRMLRRMRQLTSHFVGDYPGASSKEGLAKPPGRSWADELTLKCLIGNAGGPRAMPRIATWYEVEEEEKTTATPTTSTMWQPGDLEEIVDLDMGQSAQAFERKKTLEAKQRIMKFWNTSAAFIDRIPDAFFATTKNGYAGIVPGATQPGDRVFLPYGAKVPFIIRPLAGQPSAHHELVGECYIHGIMHSPPPQFLATDMKAEQICLV